jgi:hypothetical protein
MALAKEVGALPGSTKLPLTVPPDGDFNHQWRFQLAAVCATAPKQSRILILDFALSFLGFFSASSPLRCPKV